MYKETDLRSLAIRQTSIIYMSKIKPMDYTVHVHIYHNVNNNMQNEK